MEQAFSLEPFFSIGVTAYQRWGLLKDALASIVTQTFRDFEVIVGNDCPEEPLSGDALGIADTRIRFVNHPNTLGELANARALLVEGRGRYFTWLADDDLYAPNFLETVHAVLVRFDFPTSVFSSYASGEIPSFKGPVDARGRECLMSGREFLHAYLSRTLKLAGCYGVFNIEYLRRIGGMEQLGNGFSPYSDVLLGIRAGLMQRVVYIDAPLVFFRTHPGSISFTSRDVGAYSSAQRDLCRKCIVLFRSEGLREDFCANLDLLLRWCLRDYATVVRRSGGLTWRQAITYLMFLARNMVLLGCSTVSFKFIAFLARVVYRTALQLRVQRPWTHM